MEIMALAGGGIMLFLTVSVGVVAHELSHAAVLHLLGVQCDIDVKPSGTGTDQYDAGISESWAAVTPRGISSETSVQAMRLSSIAPLVLAVPFVLVVAGIVPDPLQTDNLLFTVFTIGWLACAVPSPQDFSVFWHAEQAVAEHTAGSSSG